MRGVVAVIATVAVSLGTPMTTAVPAHAAPLKGLTLKEAAQSHPTLTKGQRDKAVIVLKRRLDMSGRKVTYGNALQRKLMRFEHRQGMPADGGKVTGATWRALGVPYSTKAAEARRMAVKRAAAASHASRSSSRSAAVLREAARHAGKPYAYGGNGPHSFDCSGFTRYVYATVGVNLPRTAAQQRAATRWISRSDLRAGDLVFVHSGSYVSHVAIYAGSNLWWEATRPGRPLGKNHAWTSSVSYGRA
jgi:peptidoglycan DL-endopeptidase CwlO